MTDFHTHLLPKIDDGSKSLDETIKMLEKSAKAGVSRVVATPHFNANRWSVEDFIKVREKIYRAVKESLPPEMPEIRLGAEVRYYEGISRLDSLKDLCIEGTNVLLLEMPVDKWSAFALRELSELSCRGDFRLVLAHIDRYLGLQSLETIEEFARQGILMQLNADAFTSFFMRGKALKMLKAGMVQFIGSDCHDLGKRSPNIDKALAVIEKKLGKGYVRELKEIGNSLFLNK
ncbi:MAG: hypothetical protein IKT35_00060 [Clostridia bacterium]|nr:hypothetical protein [Clostridia bacterium]